MSKGKNNTAEQTDFTPVILDKSGENLALLFENFEEQPIEFLSSLDAEYLKMEENKTYNFIFRGIEKTTISDEEKEVVRLTDKHGNDFITGLTVVVNSCKKIQEQAPCFVRIITTVMTKTEKGKYLNLTVHKL